MSEMVTSDLSSAISDAETLLRYAADNGVAIDPASALAILHAKTAIAHGDLDTTLTAEFYAAYAAIAGQLHPVTAKSFRDSANAASNAWLIGWNFLAVLFTLLIVGVSVLSFLNGTILDRMKANIVELNDAAAQLRVRLGAPNVQADWCNHLRDAPIQAEPLAFDQLAALQRFATGLRDLRKDALRLRGNPFHALVRLSEHDPLDLPMATRVDGEVAESPPTDPRLEINPQVRNFPNEVLCKIGTYQSIRDFARNVSLNNEMVFGAISSFILPVLYALLGAIAFGLRSSADAIRRHVYEPFYGDSARLIMAGIAGAVLGLFNGFTLGSSFSPLAIAFLVGYAVEVFFAFLDTTIKAFRAPGEARKVGAQP